MTAPLSYLCAQCQGAIASEQIGDGATNHQSRPSALSLVNFGRPARGRLTDQRVGLLSLPGRHSGNTSCLKTPIRFSTRHLSRARQTHFRGFNRTKGYLGRILPAKSFQAW